MNCCIIGKGSIGKRHANILEKFNNKVFFLRRKINRNSQNEINFLNKKALKRMHLFIIANPSSEHQKTIKKILKFNKPIIVEKPFATQKKINNSIINYNKIFIAYQMRFDPKINFLKKYIKKRNILKSFFTWKSYLPLWHKNENYKKSYAAKKSLGGGVIYTMSHEIDLAIYLLGKVKSVYVKKYKNFLNIDVEDKVKIILNHNRSIKSYILLSFCSKLVTRKILIKEIERNLKWDFIKKTVTIKNKKIKFEENNDNIYERQIKNILFVIKNKNYNTSRIHLKKIIHTQNVINACVKSHKLQKKIYLN